MDYFISIGAINYFYFITCRSFFINISRAIFLYSMLVIAIIFLLTKKGDTRIHLEYRPKYNNFCFYAIPFTYSKSSFSCAGVIFSILSMIPDLY